MPFAATLQAARPAPMAVRDDARAHVTMPARPTSAHSAALEAWICALLMALIGNIEPLRQFFPNQANLQLPDDEAAALRLIRHAIRAENRLRARVAWLVRQHPNRGMRRSFAKLTPELRAKPARAPPRAGPNPSNSVLKTPLPAAMTHAQSPASPLSLALLLRASVPLWPLSSFKSRRTDVADKQDAKADADAEADRMGGQPPLQLMDKEGKSSSRITPSGRILL